jgi:hypothetical protein
MININKPIDNKDRKFGSANVYYISSIKKLDGELVYGLFTEKEVQTAIKRAENNVEDIVVNATLFGRFMTWLTSFFGSTRQ